MHGAQPVNSIAPLRTSLTRAALALVVIACGLSLRWYGFPLGLPAFVVKYGGSLLWATMVFLLVGVLLPRLSRMQITVIAVVIAVVVEFSRLVHVPWLDAFRLTTAGALLLGRIFSQWNLVAYAIGIAFGVWIDRLVAMRGLVGWAKAP
ncbi:ribosomal maturation YjgA family protein [Bradyrhizobium sp. USDA 377]